MTKKHYQKIAGIIAEMIKASETHENDLIGGTEKATAEYIANRLANYFKQENERFDEERFLEACNAKNIPVEDVE